MKDSIAIGPLITSSTLLVLDMSLTLPFSFFNNLQINRIKNNNVDNRNV